MIQNLNFSQGKSIRFLIFVDGYRRGGCCLVLVCTPKFKQPLLYQFGRYSTCRSTCAWLRKQYLVLPVFIVKCSLKIYVELEIYCGILLQCCMSNWTHAQSRCTIETVSVSVVWSEWNDKYLVVPWYWKGRVSWERCNSCIFIGCADHGWKRNAQILSRRSFGSVIASVAGSFWALCWATAPAWSVSVRVVFALPIHLSLFTFTLGCLPRGTNCPTETTLPICYIRLYDDPTSALKPYCSAFSFEKLAETPEWLRLCFFWNIQTDKRTPEDCVLCSPCVTTFFRTIYSLLSHYLSRPLGRSFSRPRAINKGIQTIKFVNSLSDFPWGLVISST